MTEHPLRLPHPELVPVAAACKANTLKERTCTLGEETFSYAIFRQPDELPNLWGLYDEAGQILVQSDLVEFNTTFADLIGFHEHREIRYKRAGRSHAYAHRHAMIDDLLAAKTIPPTPEVLRAFLDWLIPMYPRDKVPNPELVIDQLMHVLSLPHPRKGALLAIITDHRL